MQEVFEKIIEKLEVAGKTELIVHGGRCNGKTLALGYTKGISDAIEIVKQEAEQYNNKLIETIKFGIEASDTDDEYTIGLRNGMRWCLSLIDSGRPEYENCNNGWISCSDRLPKESGEYLTWVEYDGDRFIAIDEIDCDGIIKEWNCSTDYKIIAWQPLPQPYQPKGE